MKSFGEVNNPYLEFSRFMMIGLQKYIECTLNVFIRTIFPMILLVLNFNSLLASNQGKGFPVVYHTANLTSLEKQAVREVRRYIYLRTGKLTQIAEIENFDSLQEYSIILLNKAQAELLLNKKENSIISKIKALGDDEFYLKSIDAGISWWGKLSPLI